jgi:hypothetical protein
MESKELIDAYKNLEQKYKLPIFSRINEDFEIDKIERLTENLPRNIRKIMMEKVINSITFLDMLLNPVNSPRMYMNYIKNMSLADKNAIEDTYSQLSILSIDSLSLEIDSNEKNELVMIKKIFEVWQNQKPIFRKIFTNMKNPNNSPVKKEKTYFG